MRIFLARFWAKHEYIWKELKKAGENELNSRAALQRVATITAEADALEANIKRRDGMEEKGFWECEDGHESPDAAFSKAFGGVELDINPKCPNCSKPAKFVKRETMSGKDKYESDKERDEALAILTSKRKDAEDAQKAASYFSKLAAQSREFADRLRKL